MLTASCDDDNNNDNDSPENGPGETFATNLDTPWEMTFAPDGRMFITQRPGVVAVVEGGETRTWLELDSTAVEVGESGLTGFAIHPNFTQNGYVYVAYTYALSKMPLQLVNKIVRYREDASTKQPVWDKVILDNSPSNYVHTVARLKFGPDGMLYVSVGDNFKSENAQDLNVLNGKILRMTDDGAVPADNPRPGSLIYSYGHRNPQGLAFQPGTDMLWATEHGPSVEQGCCMDEINMIKPNANYGWPIIRGNQQQAGLETPVYYSGDTTTWAPTGAVFVTQGEWEGSLLFTGLRGEALFRAVFDPDDPTKIQTVERYFHKTFGRLRSVTEGPDGMIYLAVSNQDGRGTANHDVDRVLVFTQQAIRDDGSEDVGADPIP